MNFKRTLRAVGASIIVAASAAAVPAAAAELLDNGGFEDKGSIPPEFWGGYTYYYVPGTDLPGWTVDAGSVDITTDGTQWRPAYEGLNSLDINGWTAGKISQSFETELNKVYRVAFAYSRNLAGAPDPARAMISIDGAALHEVIAPNVASFGTPGNMQWKTGGFTFVGTGGTQTITLEALTGGNGGVFFDAVSVAVPEPATWALMIGGFGMAGAVLRRRRGVLAA